MKYIVAIWELYARKKVKQYKENTSLRSGLKEIRQNDILVQQKLKKKKKNDKLVISYMSKADKKGELWTFPKCAELLETSQEQILATKVKVQYLGTIQIRCHIISDNLIEEANATVDTKQ